MEKTKIDFIADLLTSKRLDTSHKERFFSLAAEEIKKVEITDEKIWKEITKLKAEFEKEIERKKKEEDVFDKDANEFINSKKLLNGNETNAITKDEIKHDPIKTTESLTLFKNGN